MIGTTEILILGGVVLVLFGARAIPKFFRSIGKAQSEFEKGKREGAAEATDTEQSATNDEPRDESGDR